MKQIKKGIFEDISEARWKRVYFSVILTTVIVITALSGFSYYFS